MKATLLTILYCTLSLCLFAQAPSGNITVKGMVIDSATNKPLDFVTVALQDAATKTPVKSALSKGDGSFELSAAAGKQYQLVLAFVGYNNKVISLENKPAIDLGRIMFSASSKQLGEVQISAVKPVMKQEVDRLSYDVQADPESKAYTALDMMRKVPLLSVDASDAIKLKGSGAYKILVNGKESALMAKNPSDVLKAMPATNILKIEVITTPPAKYDAEGLAGIINIITKTNADEGYNIGVNVRHNTVWGQGVNLNGTVKKGKFGFAGYVGAGRQPENENSSENSQLRLADTSRLLQNGINKFDGNYMYANAELSYEIDTLNLLTGSFEAYKEKNDQLNDQLSQLFDNTNAVTQRYKQMSKSLSHYTGIDAALNYQLGFKKNKEQLLTLSYKYSYSPNDQSTENTFTETLNYRQANFIQNNDQGTKEHTVQLDYVHPLKKINIEAGAKSILRNNYSDFTTDTLISPGIYNRNDPQSNIFDYQQNVYSAYNSYQLKGEKWSAKAGLRLEYTTINATFAAGQPELNTNYNNLIPSISVQRKLKTSSFNLGFTQRIRRPGIYQLNPFVDRTNPLFISTGNPNLKPELNNTFEFTYSNFSKGSINIGLSYAFSNNSIQSVTSFRDTVINNQNQKITTTNYENIGSNRTLGLNVNTNYDITKKLSLSLNGQVSRIWLEGTYNGKLYNNAGYIGNAFANIGYKFENGYRIGLNAGYFSGSVTLQGKSRYFMYNSYVVSKEFWDKNASIALVANNPYGKNWRNTSTTTTPDFIQNSTYNQIYRHFAIRLSYKFGKLSGEIKKNQRGINNDDKSGGKSGGGNG
ncbi:TonB-dependent receptor [Mucilaginibacter sp. UR6-1]|uniref:outer membrane beta-barrel family protein n=1 Tax=Mucilaginibacter sp. UR6-1 TaxID=1435643 RepID=UPI001E454E26|nr:outer membrane beta-barrel family protein [Mucilaginibacter sp. UR6-1]MCC8410682.1 TonB-dependent receptor [Mucilaginibacter sp. UR6-1]